MSSLSTKSVSTSLSLRRRKRSFAPQTTPIRNLYPPLSFSTPRNQSITHTEFSKQEKMKDGAVDGVKFKLEKLFAVAAEEISLFRSFEKELANQRKHLERINEILEDAARLENMDNVVKIWLKNLEDVEYDAVNVLDEIKYEGLRRSIESQGCLNIPCYTHTDLIFQWKMAHKIKDINANFKMINNEADSLGLNIVKDHPLAKPLIIETTSFDVDPIVIGREIDESNILETITSSINNALSVLPIVGMEGIGKTTLARKIYNHPRTQTH